ncbi:hypothetical protein PVK06_028377 [Gossypium arboreum]|uniref:Uncharacterized protein n=1 Tax=Gossypium arboreum TaxID=29729 RepID=A0ABR0P2X7_GOSAR|nr:hypothetical protein PVK06_028377 [Gossypium arboreum]
MHGLLKHPDSPYIRAELRRKEDVIARVNGIANFLVLLNQGFGFDFKPYVHPTYNAIMSRLTNQDQDQSTSLSYICRHCNTLASSKLEPALCCILFLLLF